MDWCHSDNFTGRFLEENILDTSEQHHYYDYYYHQRWQDSLMKLALSSAVPVCFLPPEIRKSIHCDWHFEDKFDKPATFHLLACVRWSLYVWRREPENVWESLSFAQRTNYAHITASLCLSLLWARRAWRGFIPKSDTTHILHLCCSLILAHL